MQRNDNDSKTENKDYATQDLPSPIKLSFYYESNKITPQRLSTLLEENPNVTHLEFTRCYINESGADVLIDAIDCRKQSKKYASIKKTHAFLDYIECLKISGDKISASCSASLMSAINTHYLNTLILHNVCIGDDLEEFSTLLANNPSLTELNLSDNDITDKGIIILVKHLKKNTILTHLNLNNTKSKGEDGTDIITQKGIDALHKLFEHNYWMKEIVAPGLTLQRKLPEKKYIGDTISLARLKEMINSADNTDIQIKEYLNLLLPHTEPLLWDLMNRITGIVELSRKTLLSLLSLSHTNIVRLHEVIINLAETKLLTPDTYHTVFDRITAKKPKAFASGFDKKSRKEKQNNLTHSQVTLDHGLTFFVEHNDDKKYLTGHYGSVKKAYQSIQDDTPSYSVKKLLDKNKDYHGENHARHSVKYNHLLGREAYYYKKEHLYGIVCQWQTGKSLDQFESDELKSIPPLTRFQCVINALSQLEILHSQFYIHRDVKGGNFVIDFSKNQMALIDLDGAQKKGSHQLAMGTYNFLDSFRRLTTNAIPDFCDDIFAMGKTIEMLYPECEPDFDSLELKYLTPIEYAISLLILVMEEYDRTIRCTSENALHYCQKILPLITKYSVLDESVQHKIKKIAHETILCIQTPSIEDVIRGKYNTARLQLEKLMENKNANINQDFYIQCFSVKPLHAAIETGHNEAIAYLLKHNDIDMNARQTHTYYTPLNIAYSSVFANHETLSLLLDHPSINADEKISLFYKACKDKRYDVIELLLQRAEPAMMEKLHSDTRLSTRYTRLSTRYTSLNHDDKLDESSLLHVVIKNRDTCILRLLLKQHFDITRKNRHNETLFDFAIYNLGLLFSKDEKEMAYIQLLLLLSHAKSHGLPLPSIMEKDSWKDAKKWIDTPEACQALAKLMPAGNNLLDSSITMREDLRQELKNYLDDYKKNALPIAANP